MSWVGNVPVLAHNAKFDFQILDANLKRDCKIGDLSSRWPIILDSLNIARAVEPGQKSYRLKDLLAAFNLAGKNSHLAIDDVKATKSLVDYCYKKASPIFVKQNEFYLSDIINEEQVDEIDARIKYEEKFPKEFKKALKKLKYH